MKCVQLLLVFAFFIFPSFINADKIQCQGSSKYRDKSTTEIMPAVDMREDCNEKDGYCVINSYQECEDACVYYKCVTDSRTNIMEGAGCYDDFNENCGYIKTETKNQMIKNLTKSSSEYYDNTVMIVTCDKENCARDAFAKMAGRAQNQFATALDDIFFCQKDYCKSSRGKVTREEVLCSKREWCETGKNYKFWYRGDDVITQGIKACDACVFYRCTADGGRNIMSGFGCYEDFEKICQNVPSDVKESIKKNIKDSFHFDGSSFVVTTCSDSRNCAQNESEAYYDVNPSAKIKADITADGFCEVGAVGSFSSSHQINIWLLVGLFFAGILYRMA